MAGSIYEQAQNYITINPNCFISSDWSAGTVTTTNTTKTEKTMKKFYRVKRGTPAWKAGAVLENKGNDGGYVSVNDLYDNECIEDKDYYETRRVIENSPEYFERVYPVNLLSKTVYKLKEEAREFFTKEHTA